MRLREVYAMKPTNTAPLFYLVEFSYSTQYQEVSTEHRLHHCVKMCVCVCVYEHTRAQTGLHLVYFLSQHCIFRTERIPVPHDKEIKIMMEIMINIQKRRYILK